jgi:two-component system LytT family sensor kinase
MTDTLIPPSPAPETGPPPVLSIGWRGLVLVFGFWTVYGSVMAASLYLSGLTEEGNATLGGLVAFSLLGAYAWAALTLPLFSLTQRLNVTEDPGASRVLRVAGLFVFGLAVSVSVSTVVSFVAGVVLGGLDMLRGPLAGAEATWGMARYRFPHDLLACLVLLTSGVARDYFFRYRSRLAEASMLRTQLAEARLQVLRTQLNPHFLFNTLNAVAALVQTDPKGVRRMIALLSDMLRKTLDQASEPEVPLERELELLRLYLSIMEIRFRGRLDVRISADPDVLAARVPHLILQPLVENSMKHGIGYGSESGLLEVLASREGGELVLAVRDSGPGHADGARPGGALGEPGQEGGQQGGFGLRHTRERLHQSYGEQGKLSLSSSSGGGTVAEVRLPYHAEAASTAAEAASP